MDPHHSAIQIKIWLELQLQITEMFPFSESLLCSIYHSDQRFIRPTPYLSKTNPIYKSTETNNLMIRKISNDVCLSSQLSHLNHTQRVTTSTNLLNTFSTLLKKAMSKCATVSFKLFKIVDLVGCGAIEHSNQLNLVSSEDIHLKKDNKILNFKIDSHEFKNEFQLTDIYYDQVQKGKDIDNHIISTRSSDNSSSLKEFFSTTRELTMRNTSSVMSSKRDISAYSFRTPNKPSKNNSSSSMKNIKSLTHSKHSLICKKEQFDCAIPNTMKIRSPTKIFQKYENCSDSSLSSKINIFNKSIMGSVRKVLFDQEELAQSEQDSNCNMSSFVSNSDSLSFCITRKSPSVISDNHGYLTTSNFTNTNTQKYSWLSLFKQSISSFEKNKNSDLLWILDNQHNLKILESIKTIIYSKHFKDITISSCKWINKNTLVCGSKSGKLLFGRVICGKLDLLDIWKVSQNPIVDIQLCRLGLSLAFLDQTKRLFQFSMRRVLQTNQHSKFTRELNLSSQKVFSKVSKISFHPRNPKILIILKQQIKRNEIIFYNISTKQVIHTRQLISDTHSFCFHDKFNIIFLSESKGNNHYIKIYHVLDNFKKWSEQGKIGFGKSCFKYTNLQSKNGLFIATTKIQQLYIWKQKEIVECEQTIPCSSSFINGNNLFR